MQTFVGQKINQLTVIEELEPIVYVLKNGKYAGKFMKTRRYRCLCACGRETKSRHGDIANGRARSCGCLRRKEMSEHPIGRKEKGSSYLRYMFGYYSINARKNKVPFSLTGEQFKNIVTSSCHYCGCPPAEGKNQSTKRLKNIFYGTIPHNGIDRVEPKRGYVSENCVPCCRQCNIAKHTFSRDEFRAWIAKVYSHSVSP